MEELAVLNIAFAIYYVRTFWLMYKRKKHISLGALHHMNSHTLIITYFAVSLNSMLVLGAWFGTIALTFAFLHLQQHVMKENERLAESGKWTDGTYKVKEI